MEAKEILQYLVSPVAQVSFVMAIAEIAKGLGLPSKFIPILDVILGVGLGVLVYTFSQGMGVAEGIVLGLASGLSACGLFSGAKNLIKKEEEKS